MRRRRSEEEDKKKREGEEGTEEKGDSSGTTVGPRVRNLPQTANLSEIFSDTHHTLTHTYSRVRFFLNGQDGPLL